MPLTHTVYMKTNYNKKAKQLILSGHLVHFETVNKFHSFSPALLLYFDNHQPIAVSQDRWKEYSDLITSVLSIY